MGWGGLVGWLVGWLAGWLAGSGSLVSIFLTVALPENVLTALFDDLGSICGASRPRMGFNLDPAEHFAHR